MQDSVKKVPRKVFNLLIAQSFGNTGYGISMLSFLLSTSRCLQNAYTTKRLKSIFFPFDVWEHVKCQINF